MDRTPIELRILGPTELRGPEGDVDNGEVRSPKRLALLAYLALETADGYRRRDQIVGLLWPELPQEAARTQLRKAIHGLREGLGSDIIMSRGESELRLDPALVWCDAAALATQSSAGQWREALNLYRGDLLEGLFPEGVSQEFEEWLADRRRTLRRAAATAAWECAQVEEMRGDRRAAAVMARRALDLVPDDEAGVRRLIDLLDRHGDRAGALRYYEDWKGRLLSDFGVEPAPETRKLVRRVQAARKGESHETPPTPVPIAAADASGGRSASATLPAPGSSSATAGDPATSPRNRRGRRLAAFVASITLGLAALAIAWLTNGHNPPPLSVAILPLRAIGDTVPSRVSEGFAETLADRLITHGDLAVRPTTYARATLVRGGDIAQIGRRLGVAYVVDGSVQASAGQQRVGLRLVRTDDAVAVWAGSYDFTGDSVDALAERAATDIVTVMRSRSRSERR